MLNKEASISGNVGFLLGWLIFCFWKHFEHRNSVDRRINGVLERMPNLDLAQEMIKHSTMVELKNNEADLKEQEDDDDNGSVSPP
ncbi:hypothetical protein TorRG33x02_093970 [Trema orientale]|uniref:Transmembrane protein n=1 Tax=Trema orientale TaxID=63057 RepID=A0A2P5FAR3_TREOI|nr:hypothetical protein TorRG33x02_093970 [Trema orientale]